MDIRRSIAIVIAFTLAACGGGTREDPSVQMGVAGPSVSLPTAMQQALDAQAPGFRLVPWTSFRSDVAQAAAEGGGMQPLNSVVGDFDGDGAQDAVVEGSAPGDSSLVVIAVLNKAKPQAIEVTRIAPYDADAVGIYLTKPTKGKSGAFEVVSYPDTSTVYVFRAGAFAAQ